MPVFKAIYIQPGGTKTTTLSNALSDLYNRSVEENNMILSIKKSNCNKLQSTNIKNNYRP